MVSLNANTKIRDDSQSIAEIIELNNFRFSSTESITCWGSYCIVSRQVGKWLNEGGSGYYTTCKRY